MVSASKSQVSTPPLDGIARPQRVVRPPSCLVSFFAAATISAWVWGGLFGSSPTSLNASLL